MIVEVCQHLAVAKAPRVDATVTAIGVDILAVSLWSVGVSMVGTRLPRDLFSADGVVTRIRPWELDGRVYERIGVKRWKDHLPDAGVLLGGSPKARLPSRKPHRLMAFAAETRRAELVRLGHRGNHRCPPTLEPGADRRAGHVALDQRQPPMRDRPALQPGAPRASSRTPSHPRGRTTHRQMLSDRTRHDRSEHDEIRPFRAARAGPCRLDRRAHRVADSFVTSVRAASRPGADPPRTKGVGGIALDRSPMRSDPPLTGMTPGRRPADGSQGRRRHRRPPTI